MIIPFQAVSDKHYDAYRYVPEKRETLEKWATRLREILGMNDVYEEEPVQASENKVRNPSLDDSPLIRVLSQLNGDLKNVVPDPEKRGRVKAFLETIRSQQNSPNPDKSLISECQRKIEDLIQ